MEFEERLERGDISERMFEEKCKQEGIICVNTKLFINWNDNFDLLYGDYFIFLINPIYRDFKIDVKGGSVTKRSIDNFKGNYYVIYENSNGSAKTALVFNSRFLKDLINKPNFKFDEMLSHDRGIFYSRLYQIKNNAIELNEFINRLKVANR